jgi:hypothetical protein
MASKSGVNLPDCSREEKLGHNKGSGVDNLFTA